MRCGAVSRDVECLDSDNPDDPCSGPVEYRMALSASGRSFARCEHHWRQRLSFQQDVDRRYPVMQPADFSELDAGERWDED